MNDLFLSNLTVAPNLLSEGNYQTEFWRLSIFEVKDVFRRCDALNPGGEYLPTDVRVAWREARSWGEPPYPVLDPTWPLQLARQAQTAYSEFLVRPTLEVAWELLALTDTVADVLTPSWQNASELSRHVRQVLAGPEFRLDQAAVDEHLARITGQTV